MEIFEYAINPDIFLYGDVTRSNPVLHRERQSKIEQDANFACFTTHAVLSIFPEESWVLEWIRIRVGYVWTGKFGLNADTCGRKKF